MYANDIKLQKDLSIFNLLFSVCQYLKNNIFITIVEMKNSSHKTFLIQANIF